MGRRATRAEDRLEKRNRILHAAFALLAEGDYATITMEQVAHTAGEAKGTIYLYFSGKETLFLALLERELGAWADELARTLESSTVPGASVSTTPAGPGELAAAVVHSLRERDVFVRLLALSQAILERGASYDAAVSYKTTLRETVRRLAALLAERVAWLDAEPSAQLLVYLYALVVGLFYQTSPAQVVRDVIRDHGMAEFDLDFETELARHLRIYLTGIINEPAQRAPGEGS